VIAFIRGALRGGEHHADALGAEHLIEHRRELGVAVTNKELEPGGAVSQVEHQVPGLLGDPPGGRVGCDTQHVNTAGGVLDYRKAVQPGECNRVGMEEITGNDPFGLGFQELAPARTGSARSRVDAGLLQDRPHR